MVMKPVGLAGRACRRRILVPVAAAGPAPPGSRGADAGAAHEFNIRMIRELAALAAGTSDAGFRPAGILLHQRALGIDNTPVYPLRAVPTVAIDEILPED